MKLTELIDQLERAVEMRDKIREAKRTTPCAVVHIGNLFSIWESRLRTLDLPALLACVKALKVIDEAVARYDAGPPKSMSRDELLKDLTIQVAELKLRESGIEVD